VRLFEHLALLAPVIVLALGAVAALLVIWSRVGWESLRRHEHPWRVLALFIGFITLIAVLSALGIKLPRE
jgi:di/tricarboxylate transporter